jgi:hypothetical protein
VVHTKSNNDDIVLLDNNVENHLLPVFLLFNALVGISVDDIVLVNREKYEYHI